MYNHEKYFLSESDIDMILKFSSLRNINGLANFMGIEPKNLIFIKSFESLTKTKFENLCLKGFGKPCIINDAMKDWIAKDWNFENLKARFSSFEIMVQPSLKDKDSKFKILFSDYIDYILSIKTPNELVEIDGKEIPNYKCLYGLSFHPFQKYPELFDEFDESPYFLKDYLSHEIGGKFKTIFRYFRHHWLFIGPKGSLSEFHSDHHCVMTYLAQIQGIKLAFLISPKDTDKIFYKDKILDPFSISHKEFPNICQVRFYFAILKKGEMLFIPKGWNHYVLGLTPSITLSKDIVNIYNFGDYFLKLFIGDLPKLVSNISQMPESFKKELAINWVLAPNKYGEK